MIQRVFEHALFSRLKVQMPMDLKIGQCPWNWQQFVLLCPDIILGAYLRSTHHIASCGREETASFYPFKECFILVSFLSPATQNVISFSCGRFFIQYFILCGICFNEFSFLHGSYFMLLNFVSFMSD